LPKPDLWSIMVCMNKNDLIETLAGKLGAPRSEAEKMLNTLVDVITETLKKGDEVSITGFGQFSVSNRAARAGVNPQNPTERIQIAATKVPKFRAGKSLKEAIKS
jgi:DNA-binding protein HU-beta